MNPSPISMQNCACRCASKSPGCTRKLGTTMIYVTHDQTEAMTLADKIVVLRAGNIEQIGAPLDLYDNPANQFVAGFVGSPKMNFMKAEVAADAGGTRDHRSSWRSGQAFASACLSTIAFAIGREGDTRRPPRAFLPMRARAMPTSQSRSMCRASRQHQLHLRHHGGRRAADYRAAGIAQCRTTRHADRRHLQPALPVRQRRKQAAALIALPAQDPAAKKEDIAMTDRSTRSAGALSAPAPSPAPLPTASPIRARASSRHRLPQSRQARPRRPISPAPASSTAMKRLLKDPRDRRRLHRHTPHRPCRMGDQGDPRRQACARGKADRAERL
jgi:hypothetical protein